MSVDNQPYSQVPVKLLCYVNIIPQLKDDSEKLMYGSNIAGRIKAWLFLPFAFSVCSNLVFSLPNLDLMRDPPIVFWVCAVWSSTSP